MKEKIIILTLILIFSTLHACLSVGEGEITLSRHKLILKNNGSLDIVRGDRKILPGLGFALWRKGWTDFTHQSWWQNGEIYESLGVLRVEGVEEYGEILLNYRIEVLTGSWKKAVLTRASIDVDTELEALAWGILESGNEQDAGQNMDFLHFHREDRGPFPTENIQNSYLFKTSRNSSSLARGKARSYSANVDKCKC